MFQNYKLLPHFVIWSVFALLVSDVTAGKLIDILGMPVSVAILYFPFVYIIADILTEVYGYAIARRLLWYTLGTSILASVIFQLVAIATPSAVFTNNEAYVVVLSSQIQIAVAGLVAVFTGDIVNNYVVAKMKVLTHGKYMALRLILSTLAGQLVNTAIFYTFGLWGIMPADIAFKAILFTSVAKTIIEIVMLPITIHVIRYVKKYEGVDYYDTKTDFNPFKI